MEPTPFKKPRLELSKTILEDNLVRGEFVEHMDIVDIDETVSHLRKNESEVDSASSTSSSSSSDGLVAKKACISNEYPKETVDLLFERFLMATDRPIKYRNKVEKEFGPAQYHLWGLLAKIKENSSTLREVTCAGLENISNCNKTFINVLEELKLDYTVIQFKSLKPEEVKYIFAFDINSIPKYSFFGCGATKEKAIHLAAKNGLNFFVTSCQSTS